MQDKEAHMNVSGIRSIALLAALATAGPALASEPGANLEGSWAMTITATEPAGLPPFKGLITFTSDGDVLESRRPYVPFTPFGPVIESSGHGAWERTGRRQFGVVFQFLLQAAPNNTVFTNGEDLGTDNIRLQLVRSHSGESFTGTFRSAAKDADGNVVFEARGTVTGTRLRPELE
jgi:hypothetical protein